MNSIRSFVNILVIGTQRQKSAFLCSTINKDSLNINSFVEEADPVCGLLTGSRDLQRAALDFQRKGNIEELDQLRSRYVQLTLAVKSLDSLLHSRDHYTCISSADDIIFKFNLYVCTMKI